MAVQVGKQKDDPFPDLKPEQTPGFVTAQFDLDAIAEARYRCATQHCLRQTICLV